MITRCPVCSSDIELALCLEVEHTQSNELLEEYWSAQRHATEVRWMIQKPQYVGVAAHNVRDDTAVIM